MRRGKASIIVLDDGPAEFERGLAELAALAAGRPLEDRVIFLNAWNEWAEGNYLEPDLDRGLEKLEAVRRVAVIEPDVPGAAGPSGRASGIDPGPLSRAR